ncbi:MAG: bacteriohemerythrin [Solirubrobacterales bacterium]
MSVWGDLKVQWRSGLAVGDPLIDAQHQAFFDEVNAIADALAEGAGREAVLGFYRKFLAGLAQHFRDEEALLARVGFPDIDNHHAEHEALLAAVTAIEGLLVTSQSPHELHYIVKRLFGALIEHLACEDMRYKAHLRRAQA